MHLHLTIIYRDRPIVFIYIKEDSCVRAVKEYISEATELPTEIQSLSFGGKELKDNKTLKDYHLPKNPGLLLNLAPGYALRYKIYVRTSLSKHLIRLRIGLGTTLKQVCQSLAAALDIPKSQIILSYKSYQFSKEDYKKAMIDLGVKSEEEIKMCLRQE